ncbi:Fatty acyl-CoA reductase 1 [Papilio machaon]|uniref:Fatty acyl-CoA reductase n=1 Tax=Papilio machaon TaxID=76193 RepID=A0A194RP76_PAPMA|nr:Fatty acyl-CoA reductase 1 [Papilio machaon]
MANIKSMQTCADVREMNNINKTLTKANRTYTETGEPVEVGGVDTNIDIVDKYCADCTGQERVGEDSPAPPAPRPSSVRHTAVLPRQECAHHRSYCIASETVRQRVRVVATLAQWPRARADVTAHSRAKRKLSFSPAPRRPAAHRTINITQSLCTCFLGKILVEKLLRCCPGIENLYLLVRRKRGQDIYSRLEDIFEDPVFDRLKLVLPKFRHKVVGVPADCAAPGLGLSLEDRQLLTDKVNVMFHCAATVKFDEQLRAALATNVRAPLHLLRLARDMRALDVLMHVSTAYSNSHLAHVEERFYPCAADTDRLQLDLDNMTDAQIDEMLPTILGEWPNTYTFTKALAEKELRLHAGVIPLGVFRPAIVTSTAKEPLKCWLDNMYGPTGVAVGSATGMLRTLQCDARVTADLVPVDCVVSCLLAAARRVHLDYAAGSPPPEPPIFNYVSSVENRITWGDFKRHNFARIDSQPFSNAVW